VYKLEGFLKNHIDTKHKNEITPTYKQEVAQTFQLVQGQISAICNHLRFSDWIKSAERSELQDAKFNLERKNTIFISGLTGFSIRANYNDNWKCDFETLFYFFQSLVKVEIGIAKANLFQPTDQNSKIRVKFEFPEMAALIKTKLEEFSNISVEYFCTLATQIRKKILHNLVQKFVSKGWPANMEPDHEHHPKINVILPSENHYRQFSYAEAVDSFKSWFVQNPNIVDPSIIELSKKMPIGKNLKEIFVVLN